MRFDAHPFAIGLILAGIVAVAPVAPAADVPHADPRVDIARRLSVTVDQVKPAAGGLYEVARGSEVVYVTADGRYAVAGQLYDLDQRRNLTRLSILNGIKDDDAIIFSPKNPRYTVTVFTDVDCQYCRKLHAQIAEYNRRGIRVRYVFYPRTGPNTDSWRKAEAVWCSADRREALTHAKLGAAVPSTKACPNHVAETYELGNRLGIRGTPGLFSDRGDYISGYMTPDELLDRLKSLESG